MQWYHASHDAFAKTETFQPLLYLVGLKKDLRDQCFLEDHRTGSALSPSGLMAYPTCCVCSSEVSHCFCVELYVGLKWLT